MAHHTPLSLEHRPNRYRHRAARSHSLRPTQIRQTPAATSNNLPPHRHPKPPRQKPPTRRGNSGLHHNHILVSLQTRRIHSRSHQALQPQEAHHSEGHNPRTGPQRTTSPNVQATIHQIGQRKRRVHLLGPATRPSRPMGGLPKPPAHQRPSPRRISSPTKQTAKKPAPRSPSANSSNG
jgi:hypothetical protein